MHPASNIISGSLGSTLIPAAGSKAARAPERVGADPILTREKLAKAGTTNRYLALIRAILRRACNEWEWTDRVPKFKLFKEAEGRVRSLTVAEFERLITELPEH